MADNVIRQDVIELSYEVDDGGLRQAAKQMDDLKKSITGADKASGFDDLKNNVNKFNNETKAATGNVDKMKEKLNQVKNVGVEKLRNGLKKVSDTLSTIGKKAAGAAYTGLKKIAGISFKAISAGVGAVATGLGAIATQAVKGFAEFEQLVGGVETLFGAKSTSSVEEYAKLVGKSVDSVQGEFNKLKESENMVLKNANDAYKTAGLSANEYMETASGFAASLLQGLGGDTTKAAEYANTAIIDMADNANKMGTDISSIQWAYQGFAKQNYTMLDNLKLGYGGTKTEMERLVKEASQMTDVQKKLGVTVDGSSMSFANIVNAIHVVQENMGILGTTQKEAEHTVQGSLYSMKASWQNLLVAIGSGQNLDQCFDNMISSVEIFGDNIMPVLERALSGIGTVAEKLAPKIAEKLPELAQKLIPPLIKAAVTMVGGLLKALPSIIKTVATTIVEIFGQQFPIIGQIGNFFKDNANGIAKSIKVIIPAVVALGVALKGISAVKSIKSLFGGGKGGKSGESGGLMDIFTGLAKTNTKTILQGMANLAIIIGGVTLIAAALMAIAPYMSQLSDTKSILKLLAIIGVVGLVGTGLAKLGEIAGKIQITTVLKGLANMAIMIAGTSALFLLVGAVSLINFDTKRILGISVALLALGAVGTALSVFAAIAGLLPIILVLKGLANIGLAIAGMSALFLLIGAVSLLNFDYNSMLQVVAIIGILGTVGAVLAVFAGIVGVIPMPVVLAGLANMALVLGGISAIIIAFGKLSEIPGFNDFITKGGEVLANLFNVIGKMVGSLVGGLAEGITNSLPKIGANLSLFALSLQPMFTLFNGADMSGIGNFFSALGSFLLQMTGNDILSFFTGGTDFTKLGTDLTAFAESASGFFTKVATFPENGFTNAKLLFESLAGLGDMPKEGGVAQWFGGTIDYTSLSNGLGDLSNDNVRAFYETAASLPQEGFDKAKLLFQSLSDIGNIPKTGGVKQWFTGETDLSGIAEKLPPFGEAMTKFYQSIEGITDISRISSLFTALAKIGDLPKSGGLFSGKSNLQKIADDLKYFGDTAQGFFAKVKEIDVSKMNSLWNSLKKPSQISTQTLRTVKSDISDIVREVTKLPTRMANGLKSTGQTLATAMANIWKDAVKASVDPVNKLLSGANWLLKEFGSNKKVMTWKPYAKGTDGHEGGNALVNDGRGAELVQMPNGNTFIPKGKNVFLPNAPKGMKVLPAEQTAQLMGKTSPTFRYAEGTGNIDVWSFIDDAKGLVSKVKEKFVDYKGLSGFRLNAGKAMVTTISGEMVAWVKKLFEESGGKGLASYVASKGVEQWRSTVIQALKMEGLYSEANVRRTLFQMQTESGGNPRAINLWDSNAKKGIPSKGLMQCIDPTFKAYARPGFDKNIYDPLSNILASIRYARARYGSLERAYRGVGYANGGIATKPSIFGESGAEMAIPLKASKRRRALDLWNETGERLGVTTYTPEGDANASQTTNVENNTYAPVFNLTISGSNDDRTLARKVKRWISEAMDEQAESMARRTKRLQEV